MFIGRVVIAEGFEGFGDFSHNEGEFFSDEGVFEAFALGFGGEGVVFGDVFPPEVLDGVLVDEGLELGVSGEEGVVEVVWYFGVVHGLRADGFEG